MSYLSNELQLLDQTTPVEVEGTVQEVRGMALEVAGLPLSIGAGVWIHPRGRDEPVSGEVIGFGERRTLVMPLRPMHGVGRGDRVVGGLAAPSAPAGEALIGRVLDGCGEPIDGKGPLRAAERRPLHPAPIDPMTRPPIDEPLATGVRAIDAVLPLGRGQRMGVFAAPGVGKSTLLAMMAKATDADVSVVGLVGERGREVRDFIDNQLGPAGLAKTVVVAATGDESPPMRIRAACLASSIAECFRDEGKEVLLLMDSVTRLCQAQRQIGLAMGEPPTTRGYTPSVFSLLGSVLERSGRTDRGSITGLYTVLVEGDDMDEPISDAARGILDGHVHLSRELAQKGHWPAIDVLHSISRVADDVTDAEHQGARRKVLNLVRSYAAVEDLLNIDAYKPGSNAEYDLAIACKPVVDQLLQQGRSESTRSVGFAETRGQLIALMHQVDKASKQLGRRG